MAFARTSALAVAVLASLLLRARALASPSVTPNYWAGSAGFWALGNENSGTSCISICQNLGATCDTYGAPWPASAAAMLAVAASVGYTCTTVAHDTACGNGECVSPEENVGYLRYSHYWAPDAHTA